MKRSVTDFARRADGRFFAGIVALGAWMCPQKGGQAAPPVAMETGPALVAPKGGSGGGGAGSNLDNGDSADIGDPVSAGSGAYHFRIALLSLGGPMPLDCALVYRSDLATLPYTWMPSRFVWSPNTAILRSVVGDPCVSVQLPDGDWVAFKPSGSDWVLAGPGDFGYPDNGSHTRYELKETAGFYYLMDPIEERVYMYEKKGNYSNMARVARIVDRQGNALSFSYATDRDAAPRRIADGLGRHLDLTYVSFGVWHRTFLHTIADSTGRQVVFTHESGASDNEGLDTLRAMRDPMGHTTVFHYTNAPHLVARQVLPRGNAPFAQTYTNAVLNGTTNTRVRVQQDAFGNATAFAYDPAASLVTVRTPDGAALRYEHFSSHSRLRAYTDARGATARLAKNADEQITAIADRHGDSSAFAYHPFTGKLASLTNAEGRALSFAYSPQGQVFTNPEGHRGQPFRIHFTTDGQLCDLAGMARQLRVEFAGAIYHVTCRVVGD